MILMRCSVLAIATSLAACAEPATTDPEPSAFTTDRVESTASAGLGDDLRAVPRPCPAMGSAEFDFWVGDWRLRRPTGELFATTIVTRELDGCVVMEDFINEVGNQARSMSAFDAATGTWHQVYQDNFLGNWRMEGGLTEQGMTLNSDYDVFNFNTQTVQRRDAVLVWSPLPGGAVSQVITGTLGESDVFTLFEARYEPVVDPIRAETRVFPFCQRVIPGYRQLDFWLGDWEVSADNGSAVGAATVFTDLNECMVQADFTGRNGFLQRSFMVYDFPSDEWYRYVADNTGGFVVVSGAWDGTSMILTGSDQTPAGRSVEVRNVIRPEAGGVVETWERMRPDGTWKIVATRRYGAA